MRPDQRDLVIYELLIRDFSYRSDYQTVIDSLPHLKKLGINAIELMPIIEFDGLSSWGYAPTFFFACEKYYGPEEKLKELIDSCHSNGIAVIMDIVFNHAFQPNPWLRLYYDRLKMNLHLKVHGLMLNLHILLMLDMILITLLL